MQPQFVLMYGIGATVSVVPRLYCYLQQWQRRWLHQQALAAYRYVSPPQTLVLVTLLFAFGRMVFALPAPEILQQSPADPMTLLRDHPRTILFFKTRVTGGLAVTTGFLIFVHKIMFHVLQPIDGGDR